MIRRLVVFVLCVVMAFMIIGCQEKAPEKNVEKIILNEVTHSVFYAPMYAAISLGYFEEEGLEIELVNGGGADKSMTALLSGQADVGLMGPEAAIYVFNEGRENSAMVIGQLTKRDGSFLVGREPDEDFKWTDVAGKTIIGGRKGGVPEMTLEYVLRKNGLEPGVDVFVDTSIQFDLMGGAFEGGVGDYVTLFEPAASMFEKEGKGYILAAVGQESGEVPYTAFQTTKSYIKENPDIIRRFLKAIYRGQQWVQKASDKELAEAIVDFFPDTSIEALMMVAKSYREIDAWMDTPIMKKEAFDRLQEIIIQAGVLTEKVDFENVVDNSFAEEVVKMVG
ncbi:MAG: ABC transporter substrate-binding protein [Christensenellaceae bacterium]|nr:ABC transporter substrate-binding protein [Christensenellaceae bacterium]